MIVCFVTKKCYLKLFYGNFHSLKMPPEKCFSNSFSRLLASRLIRQLLAMEKKFVLRLSSFTPSLESNCESKLKAFSQNCGNFVAFLRSFKSTFGKKSNILGSRWKILEMQLETYLLNFWTHFV